MEDTNNIHPQSEPTPTPLRSRFWRIAAIVLTLHAVVLGTFVLIQGCSKTENGPISEAQPASETKEMTTASNEAMPIPSHSETVLPSSDALTPEEHLAENESMSGSTANPSATDPLKGQVSVQPDIITPKEEIKEAIPTPQLVKYKVKKGDSLTQIAKKNKITMQALASANKLTAKSSLKVGQTLLIPHAEKVNGVVAGTTVAPSKSTLTTAVASRADKTHLVKAGESPLSIAKRYGITVQTLMSVNHITDPKKIRVNQKLVIPSSKVTVEMPAVRPSGDMRAVTTEEPVSRGHEVQKI